MIGKLLVHADNRLEAVTKMDRILDELVIQGVNTNADFQKALLHDPTVARGMFDTRYLEKEFLPRWQASLPAAD